MTQQYREFEMVSGLLLSARLVLLVLAQTANLDNPKLAAHRASGKSLRERLQQLAQLLRGWPRRKPEDDDTSVG